MMANLSIILNEVIRDVLNPLLFFFRKDLARTKSTKSIKSTKTQPSKSQSATSDEK